MHEKSISSLVWSKDMGAIAFSIMCFAICFIFGRCIAICVKIEKLMPKNAKMSENCFKIISKKYFSTKFALQWAIFYLNLHLFSVQYVPSVPIFRTNGLAPLAGSELKIFIKILSFVNFVFRSRQISTKNLIKYINQF